LSGPRLVFNLGDSSCQYSTIAQVICLVNDYKLPEETLGHALVHATPFWLTVVLTVSLILPWLRLRKVPVRAEVLSTHAVRLYFDYGQFFARFKLTNYNVEYSHSWCW
jgi:hypothetical protein